MGLVMPLPPPGEMNAPGTQNALASAQRMASILASYGNPFNDPTSSNDQDGQTLSKEMMSHSIIRSANRAFAAPLNLS